MWEKINISIFFFNLKASNAAEPVSPLVAPNITTFFFSLSKPHQITLIDTS